MDKSELTEADLLPCLRRVTRIQGLDWRRGLANIAWLQEEYRELLEIIAGMIPELSDKIASAAAAGDLPRLAVHAHSAKGSLANVGSSGLLSSSAATLEEAAKRRDAAVVAMILEKFLVDFRRFGKELTAALYDDASTVKQPEMSACASAGLAVRVDDLRRALDEFDFTAVKSAVESLKAGDYGDALNAQIAEIVTLVDELEYDEALQKLNEMR